MKAMRKDRTRRYRSASELADDIQNYLTGTPLVAGPESTVYLARKFVRRHAGSVATASLLLVVIILGLVASIAMGARAEQAREKEAAARVEAEQARDKEAALRAQVEQALIRAEKAEAIAEERNEDYRRSLYVNTVQLADAKYREGNVGRVRKLLESCPEDLRGWEWDHCPHIPMKAWHCPDICLIHQITAQNSGCLTSFVWITHQENDLQVRIDRHLLAHIRAKLLSGLRCQHDRCTKFTRFSQKNIRDLGYFTTPALRTCHCCEFVNNHYSLVALLTICPRKKGGLHHLHEEH